MKLILKQYLASLKERSELDAILPDLLSQMGINVYARPIRGANEYGVDVAAVGRIGSDVEKVYLFSIKSGNLTRFTWHGGENQALRPSLESIIDSYIPTRLPPEHRNKPIVICMCFGGDIQTTVRQEVTGFTKRNSTGSLSFEEWNGDKLSDLILEHLLKEELLPDNWQSMLRRSLALLDEPSASHVHFKKLIRAIIKNAEGEDFIVKALNRINLCLWVLFSWCRDGDNLESAYLSAEFSLLNAWEITKGHKAKKVYKAYDSLLDTYQAITDEFVDKCLIPYVGKRHAVSQAVSSPCSIGVNLKLFDFLGRLAIKGQWLLFELTKAYTLNPPDDGENDEQESLSVRLETITKSINQLVINNPLLLSPYTDEQAIDLTLALHLLSQNSEYDKFVVSWLDALVERITFAYVVEGMYPTNLNSYKQLLEHRDKDNNDEAYKHNVTKGSILYPVLAVFSAFHNAELASKNILTHSNEKLTHCTLQYWYPNQSSEEFLYTNANTHGAASTSFEMDSVKVIKHVTNECSNSNFFWQLSAVEKGYSPLVLLACRYYRYPVPFHFLSDLISHKS